MKVNGKEISLVAQITITKLLYDLKINIKKVVVEVDGEIISKDDYSSFIIKENNSVEIISFVGGG